jgi:hypothetical protein
MRRLLSLFVGGLMATSLGAGLALAGDGPLPGQLQDVRAAVARYHTVAQAAADGYFAASPCESSPAGTMGIHFINPALFGPGIDPFRPEILVYVPRPDGSMKLVAVEYFSVDADQDLATAGDRPSVLGHPFDGPMPGHTPTMPIHYDLHVWVAENNPAGVFAQWNPAISCP